MEGNSLRQYDRDNEGFNNIAIAITLTSAADQQRHLGIFVKPDPESPAKLLHLAWHNKFKFEEVCEGNYFFVDTCQGMADEMVEMFVDWLAILWEQNEEEIPYALLYSGSERFIDHNGKLGDLIVGQGFTCSTFVLECFKCYGYELIKYTTWPKREDDVAWANHIFLLLDKYSSASKEHIDAQKKMSSEIVRFRPEEVAAAANMSRFDENLLAFDDVEPMSLKIVSRLNSCSA